jgi:short-subunit dehydrogenase
VHALITGASSGIGAAMAVALGRRGWRLTLAARRAERLQAVARSLEPAEGTAPPKVFVRPADLSRLDTCAELVRDAREAMGPIHLLINNAGIQYVEPTVGITDDRADHLFAVNLHAPLRLQRLVLEEMLAHDTGTIVNIASLAGIIPPPGMMHYNAAKSALAAASESLRTELSNTGVHVLTVYPGPVTTDMEAAAVEALGSSPAAKYIPRGTPEGLADQILAAVDQRAPRVVYPRVYGITRWFRPMARWVTDISAPRPVSPR